MSDKPLKSITFPGLTDKYTVPVNAGDLPFSDSATYADGSTGKTLQNKANIDGRYENLTAGNALQLESTVRENDQTPYVFRTSGGSVDIGDREYINGIVGGTVAWNQKVQNGNFASTDLYSTGWRSSAVSLEVVDGAIVATMSTAYESAGNNLTYNGATKTIVGHKYLFSCDVFCPSENVKLTSVKCGIRGTLLKAITARGVWETVSGVSVPNSSSDAIVITSNTATAVGETFKAKNVVVFDLTQMFGSTIADYIYSLEQSTAGAGVAWFKKLFPKPYYEYNARELKSVSGLVSHDMTGFNQWDEEWELGAINTSTGENSPDSSRIRSKNYIPVVPSQTYCFHGTRFMIFGYDANKNFVRQFYGGSFTPDGTDYVVSMPQDIYYVRFYLTQAYGTTYKNDICINLAWDNSRNGEYEPYELHSYPLDTDLTLRGIPKLDANNNLYYDGDTYESDGKVTRKYGVVTFDGSQSWTYNATSGNRYNATRKISDAVNFANNTDAEVRVCCDTLVPASSIKAMTTATAIDYQIALISDKRLYVSFPTSVATSTTDVVEWFRTHPTTVVYELATPTEETADPFTSSQIVNDFGTEEYIFGDSAFPIPVGHNTDYPIDLKAKVEMAPNSPDGDGDYIVRQTNGMNEYVPLIIEDALPTIPSTAGSYKLTVTVAEGSDPVLSWESEA